jgi:hypothetical protein
MPSSLSELWCELYFNFLHEGLKDTEGHIDNNREDSNAMYSPPNDVQVLQYLVYF